MIALPRRLLLVTIGLLLGCGGSDGSGGGGGPAQLAFHGEDQPFAGFHPDTGLQPPNPPAQIELQASANAKLAADLGATSGGGAVVPVDGSGKFAISGGFGFGGRLKIDVSGVGHYDGPIPGIENVNVPITGSAPFTPDPMAPPAHAVAAIPETKLPPIPLPGGIPGDLTLIIADGTTVTSDFVVTCAAVDAGKAHVVGRTTTSGTLVVKGTITIKTPLGDKPFNLPAQSIPLPMTTRPLDLGVQAVAGGGSPPPGKPLASGTCAAPPPTDGGAPLDDGGVAADGSNGNDGGVPPVDGGAGEGTGRIYLIDSDSTQVTPGVSAAFTTAPSLDGCTVAASYPACKLYACNGAPNPTYVSAGMLSVSGLSFGSVTLTPDASNLYGYAGSVGSPLFAPGATLGITASGGAVPAFSTSVGAPATTTLTSPDLGMGAIAVSTSSDLFVSWSGGAAGTIQGVTLNAGTSSLVCHFDASGGGGTIPRAALATFAGQGNGTYMFDDQTSASASAGGWDVEVLAVHVGALWAGSATFQ